MLLKARNPRTLFRLGLATLALFGILGMIHPDGRFNEGVVDGVRGALIGASIALLFFAFRAERRA